MGLKEQLERFAQPDGMYSSETQEILAYGESDVEIHKRIEPTASELRDSAAAPGVAPEHPVALLYMADHETIDDGLCRQARTHARALANQGVPLRLQTIRNMVRHGEEWFQPAGEDILHPDVLEEVKDLRRVSIGVAGIVLHHTALGSASALDHQLVPHHMRGSPAAVASLLARTIVYAPLEADRVPEELARLLAGCGQVWVQCQANLRALQRSGVPDDKLYLVPNAWTERSPALHALEQTVPRGKRFYHIGKWEPRKNQHQMIGAFLHAYGPHDGATLTLKIHGFGRWPGYPHAAGDSVMAWLESRAVKERGWTADNVQTRVIVYDWQFSEREIGQLHSACNIYVSASHAEGWDYPAFDALVAGNTLLHVGNGGSEDYARPEWCETVPWEIGPVDPSYVEVLGWHPDSRWALPLQEGLVAAFRHAEPPAKRERRRPLDFYLADAVGKEMRSCVAALAAKRCPQLLAAMPLLLPPEEPTP